MWHKPGGSCTRQLLYSTSQSPICVWTGLHLQRLRSSLPTIHLPLPSARSRTVFSLKCDCCTNGTVRHIQFDSKASYLSRQRPCLRSPPGTAHQALLLFRPCSCSGLAPVQAYVAAHDVYVVLLLGFEPMSARSYCGWLDVQQSRLPADNLICGDRQFRQRSGWVFRHFAGVDCYLRCHTLTFSDTFSLSDCTLSTLDFQVSDLYDSLCGICHFLLKNHAG